jgi:hypothetical protein
MNQNLFRLALERLQPSDWEHFERLSSAFLISEFGNLRTMASPSGDGGRDSELFSSEGSPFIAAQYSIAADWKAKILRTVNRLEESRPKVRILLYLSNRQIGGQADDLRGELLRRGVALDARDRNWFIERATSNEVRENAAQELIDRIARPYLEGEQIIDRPSSPLSSGEARAALLYLGLQWQDDISDKGLTKLSFDALVRAALRHTHSERRHSRSNIHEKICTAVSSTDRDLLLRQVDSALKRLTKRYIRHWRKEDEFCLTHEEHQRITLRLAELENEGSDFQSEVAYHIDRCVDYREQPDRADLQRRIPRILEKLLLKRGEFFVSAVLAGDLRRIGFEDLDDIILNDLSQYGKPSTDVQHLPGITATIIRALLVEATPSTQRYLRRLANSYTLLSFLKQTPDVKSATRKLFSHGTIWLDTTVLLPLFAEQLEDNPSLRKFTRILKSCRDAGNELRVTSGVISEISYHMNKSLACSQHASSTWRGRVPYLYYQYLHTGQPVGGFRTWLSLFRGDERPEDDLAQVLTELFEIKRKDLGDVFDNVDDELRWAAERLWSEAHELRRRHAEMDEATTRQLILHDLETYLGVIDLRKSEEVSELGYKHWLLTFDRIAWQIRDRLKEEFHASTPQSPLLSLSFLTNNLTFGPHRHLGDTAEATSIPLLLDVEMSESMPHDILKIAEEVRAENEGLPEYVIRRKVRDAIDTARHRLGCFGDVTICDSNDAEQESPADV